MPETWNEGKVADRLRHVFPHPAHVILEGVRNGTGYAKKARTADALIASVYPSRGIWIAGVEIKVCRGDWKRELANPDKASDIEQYCNMWFIAAPEGVVPVNELPESWGLIEVKTNTAKIVKKCVTKPKADIKPIDALFLCSVLRNFSESVVPTRKVNEIVQQKFENRLKNLRIDFECELNSLRENVKSFEDASGVRISDSWRIERIGEAVKLIVDAGSPKAALERLLSDMKVVRTALDHIEKSLKEMNHA